MKKKATNPHCPDCGKFMRKSMAKRRNRNKSTPRNRRGKHLVHVAYKCDNCGLFSPPV